MADFEEEYLEDYVFEQDQEFMVRCRKAIASLQKSLASEGIAVDELNSWFVEGLKILYASCVVDEFLRLDTQIETNFQKTLAALEGEVRERNVHIQVVLKRFKMFPTSLE